MSVGLYKPTWLPVEAGTKKSWLYVLLLIAITSCLLNAFRKMILFTPSQMPVVNMEHV